MTRTRIAFLVGLSGLALLAAALLTKRSDVAIRQNPPKRAAAHPPAVNDERPSAAAAQVREAEQELLALCAKRDRLLRIKKEMDQPKVAPSASSPPERVAMADEYYRLAEGYFQAGAYDRAAVECQRAIETDPGHLAARALLAEVRFISGKGRSR